MKPAARRPRGRAVGRLLSVFVLSLALGTGPALGQSGGGGDDPEQMLKDATRQILRAFELMFKSIPQYTAPEVLENGDIIIRRIHPEKEKPVKPETPKKPPDEGEPPDRTKT